MKNKLKAIFLCMLYVSGYQTLSAGTIPGDYSNKRIVISGIINNLKNPRYREKPISPIVVGFAPRAILTGINQPPLVYDNFFLCANNMGIQSPKI